jgi:hypothetical protein
LIGKCRNGQASQSVTGGIPSANGRAGEGRTHAGGAGK